MSDPSARCPISDLPVASCAHCAGHTTPGPITITALEHLAGHPVPAYRHRLRTVPLDTPHTSARWANPAIPPRTIRCDHPRTDGLALCTECEDRTLEAIADVPALVADLHLAHAGLTRFGPGTTTSSDPDSEGGAGWNDAASRRLTELHDALAFPDATARLTWTTTAGAAWMLAHWPDLRRLDYAADLAHDITRAVTRARHLIDRPRTLVFYGACPQCDGPLRVERDSATVACGCGWIRNKAEHIAACIEAAQDRWLTIPELVEASRHTPHPATATQIGRWAHHGQGDLGVLPREILTIPHLVDGSLTYERHDTYRLRDIAEYAQAAAEQRHLETSTVTTAEAADRLGITDAAVRKLVERGRLEPVQHGTRPLRFLPAVLDALRPAAVA